jgi:hypothetical protein
MNKIKRRKQIAKLKRMEAIAHGELDPNDGNIMTKYDIYTGIVVDLEEDYICSVYSKKDLQKYICKIAAKRKPNPTDYNLRTNPQSQLGAIHIRKERVYILDYFWGEERYIPATKVSIEYCYINSLDYAVQDSITMSLCHYIDDSVEIEN